MDSSIEIDMGSNTEIDDCLKSQVGFMKLFTVWFQGCIWLFTTGKMTKYLDPNSKILI